MKKLLSIFTIFTAVSVVSPTVVACGQEKVSVESIAKEIAKDSDIITKAKAYQTDASKESELTLAIKAKLKTLIKEKLKNKKEIETVETFIDSKYTITLTKEAEKIKMKIEKALWDDAFATDASKKNDVKATYDAVEGISFEAEISTK